MGSKMGTVVLEAKLAGRKDRHEIVVGWPPSKEQYDDGSVLVRELIALAVENQREVTRERDEDRRAFQALLAAILERGQEDADAKPRSSRVPATSSGDPEELQLAIHDAWKAFQRELYYLLVDGRRMQDLDQRVRLGSNSRVTFLRRVEFTGG